MTATIVGPGGLVEIDDTPPVDVNIVGGSVTLPPIGAVDQGAPGATPWLVDDDQSQALLVAILAQFDDLTADTVLGVLKAILTLLTSGVVKVDDDEAQAALGALGALIAAGIDVDTGLVQSLTDAELRASAPAVKDDYQTGECLDDQTGTGAVLTFTFSAPVHLVVVDANGAATDVARADPFGGTPTAVKGFCCRDEAPAYMPVTTSAVEVYAPVGMVVSVAGYRRS